MTSLTTGRMRVQGERLSDADRRAVAEFLTGRAIAAAASSPVANQCRTAPSLPGRDSRSRRGTAGAPVWRTPVTRPHRHRVARGADVPQLKLKWAFGFEGALAARTQPSIVGGMLFTGSERGDVYALDAKTGCTHWTYRAQAAVRTAMTVAPYRAAGHARRDTRSTSAMDVPTPTRSMPRAARRCGCANSTSIPTPPSPVHPPCTRDASTCRHRRPGKRSAVDGSTTAAARSVAACPRSMRRPAPSCGSRTASPTEPKPRAVNKDGVQLFGPAGAGIWGAPTIDAAARCALRRDRQRLRGARAANDERGDRVRARDRPPPLGEADSAQRHLALAVSR